MIVGIYRMTINSGMLMCSWFRLREGLSSTQAIEEAYAALQLQHEILLSRMDSYQSEARDMGNLNASLRGFPSDEVVGRVGYVQGLREEVAEMKEVSCLGEVSRKYWIETDVMVS